MSEIATNYYPGDQVVQGFSGGDKKKFLAGEYKFVPEMFEVWKFNCLSKYVPG